MQIPQTTEPLTKFIRTTEGVLVIASNVVLDLAALLPHGLSWQKAGLYQVILNGATVIGRSGLKAFAGVNKSLNVEQPPDSMIAAALAEEQRVLGIQSAGGTPENNIEHGLSPSSSGAA